MTLPKFEQERRIDLVTAVNELSESTQAAFDDLEVDVPVASPDVAGVVKVGSGLAIKQDGTLSADVTKDYVANEVAGVEAHLTAFEEETAEQISNESTARQNGDEQLEDALQTVKSGLEKNIDDNLAICTNGLTSINNDLNKNAVKKVSATNGITASIATGTNAGATLNVGVKAGNGLSVNKTTGMLEVPVDTESELVYSSAGISILSDSLSLTHANGLSVIPAVGISALAKLSLNGWSISSYDATYILGWATPRNLYVDSIVNTNARTIDDLTHILTVNNTAPFTVNGLSLNATSKTLHTTPALGLSSNGEFLMIKYNVNGVRPSADNEYDITISNIVIPIVANAYWRISLNLMFTLE